ncbi:ORF3 [Giant panda anellovirus]|uniref:ORF3 n=1 Tax=Giant panda anellovirus TaxID=2016460 RepID=A0A220IGN3_9VIRU|nr:ORF3 [Giant panda anellovirus]ASH99136.1 ORF3 [Giant panda anellovirus]
MQTPLGTYIPNGKTLTLVLLTVLIGSGEVSVPNRTQLKTPVPWGEISHPVPVTSFDQYKSMTQAIPVNSPSTRGTLPKTGSIPQKPSRDSYLTYIRNCLQIDPCDKPQTDSPSKNCGRSGKKSTARDRAPSTAQVPKRPRPGEEAERAAPRSKRRRVRGIRRWLPEWSESESDSSETTLGSSDESSDGSTDS